LLVRWLSELNFQLMVKNFLISKIETLKIKTKNGHYYLFAQIHGDNSQAYLPYINNEIKAVTYHKLKIEESQGEFITQVIFDI
jgi:SHS2 domain-containing protein